MSDLSPPSGSGWNAAGSEDRRAALLRLASQARHYLESIWPRWHQARGKSAPIAASTGTCGRSSLFLRDVLRLEGHHADWANGIPRIAPDGHDIGPFGFRADSRWESHAWVVSGDLIVDITADQFGAAPVIVTPAGDPRYGVSNTDTAWPDAIKARYAAVEAIWPGWLHYKASWPT